MGKVLADLKLTSLYDLRDFKLKRIREDEIRRLLIHDVIVDSGASMLCLSKSIIDRLDLEFVKETKVNTADGVVTRGIYGPVVYEIQGRSARGDVLELAHPKVNALIGQIPLEQLDFLINPAANKLVTNPEHEGELILDQLIISEDLQYEIKNE
jgi:predicted aspartyl protease